MSNVIKLGSITPYKTSVFKVGATTEGSYHYSMHTKKAEHHLDYV